MPEEIASSAKQLSWRGSRTQCRQVGTLHSSCVPMHACVVPLGATAHYLSQSYPCHTNVATHARMPTSHPSVAPHTMTPHKPPECGTATHKAGSPFCRTTGMWHRTSPHRGIPLPPQCGTHGLHECSPLTPPECGSLGSPERGPTRTWHATRWPSDPVSLQVPSVSTPDREATIPPGATVTTHPPPPQHC